MGHGALLLGAELAEGLAELRHQKHGVIAEAALPHGGEGDGAVAAALGGDGLSVGECAANRAGEVGGAGGLPPHGVQQQHVADLVFFQDSSLHISYTSF